MGLLRRIRQRALRAVPLTALNRVAPRSALGLYYHAISNAPMPHVRHLLQPKTPEQFASDLRFLRQNFRLLSYADLCREMEGGAPPGPPGVVLTFDDGYAECFSVVRPLLLQFDVPCIFFVTTGCLDNRWLERRNKASLCIEAIQTVGEERVPLARLREVADRPFASRADAVRWLRGPGVEEHRLDRVCALLGVDVAAFLRERQPYLTTPQVKRLAADGFTIGAHTRTHPQLERVPAARVEEEIVGSCEDVQAIVGAPVVPFAFPFTGKAVDRGLLARIRAAHPVVGMLFDTQRLRREHRFIFHRIPADRPPDDGGPRSTLPDNLRSAYLNQAGRAAAEWLRLRSFSRAKAGQACGS